MPRKRRVSFANMALMSSLSHWGRISNFAHAQSLPALSMAALKHGSRKFYEIPSENLQYVRHDREVKNHKKIEELLKYIENSCIGKDLTFTGPYGLRKGKLQDFKAAVLYR